MLAIFGNREKDANLTQIHLAQSSVILATSSNQNLPASGICTFVAQQHASRLKMGMPGNIRSGLLDYLCPGPGGVADIVVHILVGYARCSADLCYRSLFINPQNATEVMVAIFSCISSLCLRMKSILMPKTVQSVAKTFDLC